MALTGDTAPAAGGRRHHGRVSVPVPDPRSQRTVARLERALHELLLTREAAEISVAELCRTAGVHRTTFYKHYASVSQFTWRTFGTMLEELAVLRRDDDAGRAGTVRLLEYVAAQRDLYRRLLGPSGDLAFQRATVDHLVHDVEPTLVGERRHERALVQAFAMLGMAEAWAFTEDEDAAGALDDYLWHVRS